MIGEGSHLPVGLCRMKNRKGLSTINQGGDDLAIRIAAMGRKGKCDVHQHEASKLATFTDPQMLVSEDTLHACPVGWPCYNRLNSYHLLSLPWARPFTLLSYLFYTSTISDKCIYSS